MPDEIPREDGDTNVVVRVGDTVRRPPEPRGEWRGVTPGEVIVANLEWTEARAAELLRFLR